LAKENFSILSQKCTTNVHGAYFFSTLIESKILSGKAVSSTCAETALLQIIKT